ncbi:tRNA (guanosine(37)-N1)-methyltransferase TrmD [Allopusillimonas ginsengisoli]|uniref:tRNA (guanosine(37)-N1)-methyltransferase TrmD n=1 Tax=Allopusillimonas ginsengisoli TaxID=453575 RepID=UPI00101F6BE3|nr:tRNA (guanosine(37)-N1)-methyltransferase TrmD [Allopusillimonas ginsengisoli]TEA77334.1 tRNA (guanosine(37)-N1)-methyltransferase TrmD [Allopusillimonas ginsengisoli]
MRFDVITLFPDMFSILRDLGISGRAHKQALWSLKTWNPRDFTHDAHRTVDDRPYGGGPGMVMLADPLEQAVTAVLQDRASNGLAVMGDASEPDLALANRRQQDGTPVMLMSPTGKRFDQRMAQGLAEGQGAILICGRYEGIDQRFVDRCVTHEVSLGDFVLSGGEVAALAMMDAAVRLLPGALNDAGSAAQDSFNTALTGLLDSPHYTRPEVYHGMPVPPELLSGHHANIAVWRRRQSLRLTAARRPDLIQSARETGQLSKADEQFLQSLADLPPQADQ